MSNPTDAAWYELEADALASDGPIADRDVKDAIKRHRATIEAAVRADEIRSLRKALLPKMIHPGHFREPFLLWSDFIDEMERREAEIAENGPQNG